MVAANGGVQRSSGGRRFPVTLQWQSVKLLRPESITNDSAPAAIVAYFFFLFLFSFFLPVFNIFLKLYIRGIESLTYWI